MDYNNGDPIPSNDFVRYRGDHHIYYTETITVTFTTGAKTNLTRTGRLTTPIDVYIQRLYSANTTLNVSTSLTLYSPFDLKAAVTATTVKANSTTALVSITFGISNPYEILCISNRQNAGSAGTYTAGLSAIPNDISAFPLDSSNNTILEEQVCEDANAGLSTCSSYDKSNMCWKTVNFLILTNGVCSLSHTFLIDQITIGCAPQYTGADCPLQTPDTSSAMQFTVKADKFCDGQRAMVINDAVVIKSYVPQNIRSRTNDTPLPFARIGQSIYLTLFIDTLKSLRVFSMTVLPVAAGGFQTKIGSGSYGIPDIASQYISNANYNLNGDGFDIATQTHSMSVNLGCDFVQDGAYGDVTRNCLVVPSIDIIKLSAKLTFYVDYESGKRRRRQVQSDRGYASMSADVPFESEESTAGIPSSAGRNVYSTSLSCAVMVLASVALLI